MATKLSQDELLEAIDGMTVLELSEFIKAFEERYGVTAAAPAAVAVAAEVQGHDPVVVAELGRDVSPPMGMRGAAVHQHPITCACRADVDEAMAAGDADNLFRFLQRRAVIDGDPGALPDAPISGAWFSAQFQELLRNAWPPIGGGAPEPTPNPDPGPGPSPADF